MDETVYVLLEGGIVLPISHVSGDLSPANTTVVIYDGETYRDHEPLMMAPAFGPEGLHVAEFIQSTFIGSDSFVAEGVSDVVSHTAPRYKGKQATLWTFDRTISEVAAFKHRVWAHQVIGTSSHSPYRIGMVPTTVS